MDLVASCKDKLAYFRIKELKDVLTQLGLSKQGKKQDLVDRIMNILSEESAPKIWPKKNSVGKEEVAKLVDDIYRKMQVSGATDLASMGQGVSNSKVKGEIDDPFQRDIKVRCPCTNALETESMIKCEDPRCHVWQHIGCVIIPEKPMEGSPPLPELFYCELCRLSRADPFWVTMVNNLYPVKLTTTDIPTDGSNPVQRVERTFHVSRADKEMVSKQDYDIQAWCMLLNDKVPFRMHWPLCADLQVNGIPVRAVNRPGTQLLGANGRDDGPIITPCVKDGPNKIALTGIDARIFCLGVRLVKRRSVQQILGLIPKESDGESFEDALARVCRCVGGGPGTDNADSDSDLEVVAESISVNLRCPMSGSRIKVAGRFKPCVHMGGFDLDVFVELNQRSRKWQCPICLKNYSLENVIIDPYFNRITSKVMFLEFGTYSIGLHEAFMFIALVAKQMRHCGEDIAEIELKPDGSWRVKTRTEAEHREVGELALWHTPAGSFSTPNGVEVDSKAEVAKQIKQEGMSGHTSNGLKIGIRKNRNGFWEVSSKPEEMNTSSSGNRLLENFESHEHKIIPMSSSATGSGRDDEDPSVNQDAGVNFDFTNNGVELDDSLALNGDHSYGFVEPNFPAPQGDAEVIVLSDSDDDILVYNDNQTDNGGATFSMPQPGIADPYPEDPTLGNDGTSSFGLFNPNDDEFGMSSLWHLPPETQAPPGFQLFSSDVSDALVDISHGPINCSTSINGYTLGSDMGPSGLIPDTSVGRSDTEMNDGLVNNPLAFGGEDPSLQIFLPTRPSNASVQSDVRDQTDVSNGVHTEDWISLRLGGGTTGSHGDSVAPNGINSRQHIPPREAAMDSLADTASLLLGMNDGRSDKASRKRSDSPFSFPRQKRSVRPPRLYLSIDSDSE